MKKQLIFSTEDFYYKLDEDGEVVYDEYGDEYDEYGAQWQFEDIIAELDDEKYKTEARRFAKVKIYPDLGLWDGRHKCYAEEEDDFSDAIHRCIGRDIERFEIYQAGKWTLYINAYHHDGTNHFKLTCYL
jgi:hypothetical protein